MDFPIHAPLHEGPGNDRISERIRAEDCSRLASVLETYHKASNSRKVQDTCKWQIVHV